MWGCINSFVNISSSEIWWRKSWWSKFRVVWSTSIIIIFSFTKCWWIKWISGGSIVCSFSFKRWYSRKTHETKTKSVNNKRKSWHYSIIWWNSKPTWNCEKGRILYLSFQRDPLDTYSSSMPMFLVFLKININIFSGDPIQPADPIGKDSIGSRRIWLSDTVKPPGSYAWKESYNAGFYNRFC